MKRGVLLLSGSVVAIGALILAVLFTPVLREELRLLVLVPLIKGYHLIRYHYIERLPQFLLWAIPLALLFLIIFRSILRFPRSCAPTSSERPTPAGVGNLARIARHIHRARSSRIARVRLCRRVFEIAARLVARHEGLPLEQARDLLRSGAWDADPAVVTFLRSHHRENRGGRDFVARLEHIVAFLEKYHQEV